MRIRVSIVMRVVMQALRYSCTSERCSSNVSYDARAFIVSESVFRARGVRVLSRLDLVSNLVRSLMRTVNDACEYSRTAHAAGLLAQ